MQREYITGREPRRMIASYTSYAEAQRAVDYLSDQRFPVERTAIVAEGLSFVEQVTGRMGYGQAALGGAANGVVTGAFVGFIVGLFSAAPLIAAMNLALFGLLIGAVLGAVLGLIGYAATGGRRDFSSVGRMAAERYNIMVDDQVAGDAERMLGQLE